MDDNKYISKLGQHAIVLGGSGGIGREIVRALAANGVKKISYTYGKNKQAADELGNELRAQGIEAFCASIERLDESGFRTFLNDAVAALGTEVDMAVDAIGISPNTPHMEQTEEEWMKVYSVNVIGSFFATRSIASRMKEKGVHGSIVLIASTNGLHIGDSSAEYSVHYDSSKSAQIRMMRTMAKTYAPDGIRINSVSPGWIRTSMNDTLPPGEEERESARIWLGPARKDPFAHPAEVANTVKWLLSSDASYVTGQNIVADGGYE